MKNTLIKSIRETAKTVLLTLLVCSALYPVLIWSVGHLLTPERAEGSLIRENGKAVGSRLIAQKFTRPEYFHSRPSAVDYNAAGSGGSNLSPNGNSLRNQVISAIDSLHVGAGAIVPVELVTASGSGLDPHLTIEAVEAQLDRVARARGRSVRDIRTIVIGFLHTHSDPMIPKSLFNVLELNRYLDRLCPIRQDAGTR